MTTRSNTVDIDTAVRRARAYLAGGDSPPYHADTTVKIAHALIALTDRLPTCAHCEQRPAACFGCYESEEHGPAAACDVCCGHGNEDGWCVPIAELPAWAAKQRQKLAEAHAEIEQLRVQVEQMAAHPLVVASPVGALPPERAAELSSQLAAINRGSQQLVFEATDPGAAESLVAEVLEQVRACVAGPPPPGPIQLVPIASVQTPQERIASLEAELAKARRAVAFFTTAVEDGFDWEAWLEGRIDGPPPEVGRHERIVELEAALRGLVARVDRAGGYASSEEQDAMRRARQVLAGAGVALREARPGTTENAKSSLRELLGGAQLTRA